MSVDRRPGPVEALAALGEPLRWRIAELLAGEELCVTHLVEALGASQSLVSHHLRVLRDAGLVDTERHRYWTYYRLQGDVLAVLVTHLARMAGGAPGAGVRRRPPVDHAEASPAEAL